MEYLADGEYGGNSYDLVNYTNNGLERYNRHFNSLFNKKPSLLEFVQIVEEENPISRTRKTLTLEDVEGGRR